MILTLAHPPTEKHAHTQHGSVRNELTLGGLLHQLRIDRGHLRGSLEPRDLVVPADGPGGVQSVVGVAGVAMQLQQVRSDQVVQQLVQARKVLLAATDPAHGALKGHEGQVVFQVVGLDVCSDVCKCMGRWLTGRGWCEVGAKTNVDAGGGGQNDIK